MGDAGDSRLAHAFFKGVAKIPIEALKFDHDLFVHQHRPVSEKIVERLRTIFRREGCLRYDSGNWIDALVDPDHLDSVLSKNGLREADLQPDAQKFPLLELNRVDCLQGVHRVLAASKLLTPNDRWWTVKLYSRDLPRNACIKIIEGSLNEQPHSDGAIFRKIRLYHRKNDRSSEQKWWARLTTTKQKDLRQLLKNPEFTHAFDSLIDMPGLWYPVKLGTLHRLLTLRCDEELLNYLSHISRVWKNILGASNVSSEVVDRNTVEKLELLAPSASTSDRKLIEDLFSSGEVFCDVTDRTARETLLSAILSRAGLIPTLRTFFENLKYLEPCCHILKKIIPAKEKRTIYQSLSGSYFTPSEQTVEYAERKRRKRQKRDYDKDLWLSYVQLWAFCMRHFPAMTQLSPRKELGKDKPLSYSNTSLWHYLGNLATTLGFQTEQALAFRAQNPHEALTEQLLRSVCPDSTPDTRLVTRVAAMLKQTEAAPEVSGSPSLTREGYLPMERRCGRPFEDDFVEDKDFLFIPLIYGSESSAGQDIGSFFVKRDMFFSFFGNKYETTGEDAETDDGGDDDNDDGDHQPTTEVVDTSQDHSPDQASVAKIQELDGALRKEKQQTDQLQKRGTQLESEIKSLQNQLLEQTKKATEMEKRGENLQTKHLALETSSTMDNGQLKEEMANLKVEREKITQELEDTRAKLQEKAQQLEDMAKRRDHWEELHRKLQEEMDMEGVFQPHPDEGSLERDLNEAKDKVSHLEKELSEAKADAQEKTRQFEDEVSEAKKATEIANEKVTEFKEAFEREKTDAQKNREAQEEAQKEMSKFQDALQEAEKKAEECRNALDSSKGKIKDCEKALDEAGKEAKERKAALLVTKAFATLRKRKLNAIAMENSGHEKEIAGLRHQVANAEDLHKQKDDEAQRKENICRETIEQLKRSLDEREKQTKHLEQEIQGLKDLAGDKTSPIKNQTFQNKAIMDLFSLSRENFEGNFPWRHPSVGISIQGAVFHIYINPDGDGPTRIDRALKIIRDIGVTNFDLWVGLKDAPRKYWKTPYIMDVLKERGYCIFYMHRPKDYKRLWSKRVMHQHGMRDGPLDTVEMTENRPLDIDQDGEIVAWVRGWGGKKRRIDVETGNEPPTTTSSTSKTKSGVRSDDTVMGEATSNQKAGVESESDEEL